MARVTYFIPPSQQAIERLAKWIKRQEKQCVIAKEMGISPQLLNYKLNNNAISGEDLLKIFHILNTPGDEIAKVMTY